MSEPLLFYSTKEDRERIADCIEKAGCESRWCGCRPTTGAEEIQQLVRRDRLATLGTLIGGIAHELNNPAHLIRLNVEFLQVAWAAILPMLKAMPGYDDQALIAGMNPDEAARHIEKAMRGIVNGAERVSGLIEELNTYACTEPPDGLEAVDLRTVIHSASLLLADTIRRCTSSFTVHVAPETPCFTACFRQMEQVVLNLLHNACLAVKETRGTVEINVQYEPENKRLILRVRDNGVGIAPENLEHIMDPFFTTRRELGGAGLGLAVCQSILREQRGELNLESEPGRGTTVTVRLPISPEQEEHNT